MANRIAARWVACRRCGVGFPARPSRLGAALHRTPERPRILGNGNPPNILRMGTLSGIGAPPLFALPSTMAASSATLRGERDRRASRSSATSDGSFHKLRSPFWEGHGGVLAGRSAYRMDERPRGSRQSVDLARDSREQQTSRLEINRWCRHHSSHCDFVVQGRWS
jgi:hypothetical protein